MNTPCQSILRRAPRAPAGRKGALCASFGVRELWVDFQASERIVPLLVPEAFALRLDELELE
jgi:hypothetical protein